ncbi:hypothetical protein ACF0H5_004124 [Mactra antiquata]
MGFSALFKILLIFVLTFFMIITAVDGTNCQDGQFGRDCLLECHCSGGLSCDDVGSCTACAKGWTGPTCQLQIENVALNKSASQEPETREEKNASYAVDGDITTYSWVMDKEDTKSVSLTVDLGQPYFVHSVFIAFNATVDKRRSGFSVIMSDNKQDVPCYHHTLDDFPDVTVFLPNCSATTRYVTVANSRDMSPDTWSRYPNLVIAELEVFSELECSTGTYGSLCERQCGHCMNQVCDKVTGACQGDCEKGYFGAQCNEVCPANCQDGCHKDNGHCIGGCVADYYGDYCNISCPISCKQCDSLGGCIECVLQSTYGTYCNISCPNCNGGCQQSTGLCINGCKDKFYGSQCEMTCNNCATVCDVKGVCTDDGCIPNHYGDMCDKKCSTRCVQGENCERSTGHCGKCEMNQFGDFCEHDCSLNCLDTTCHRNGTCMKGCINKTYHGEQCNVLCSTDIPNCLKCEHIDGRPKCLKCENSKYGDNCLMSCPDNCEDCTTFTECTKCKTGYSGDICQNECKVDNCLKCAENNLENCIECENGWFGTMCDKKCLSKCRTCLHNETFCTSCDEGKFLLGGECPDCDPNCIACENPFNCSQCVPGIYGDKCDRTCPANCLECTSEETCTKCQDGYEGDQCLCSHSCNRVGDVTQWCNVSTGTCLKGCVDGKFGEKCDYDCPERCSMCEQIAGKCQSCVSGYYGLLCNEECGHCMPEGGNVECNKQTGQCIGKCQDGYYGLYCNKSCSKNCNPNVCDKDTGHCTYCLPGYYGDQCEKNCSQNCNDWLKQGACDKTTGVCLSCQEGLYGANCSLLCGNNCELSPGRVGCNQMTGHCVRCKQRFYGDKCEKHCGVHCASDCDKTTGECDACKSNYFMPFCDITCPPNCGPDPMGSKKIVCNRYNGECIHCQPGYYGEKCVYECPENCFKHCNKVTGMCNHCKVGYYGDYCADKCSVNCLHTEHYTIGSCNQTSGDCNDGCKSGFKTPKCITALPIEDKPIGTIIGIIVAVLLAIIIIFIIAFVCYRYRRALERERRNAGKINGAHKRDFNGQRAEEINPLIQNNGASLFSPTNLNNVNESAVDDSYNVNTKILVSEFTKYLHGRKSENPEWFKEEFAKLPRGLIKPSITATSYGNRGRCRYKQLYPYDHNRVKLDPDGEDTHDFINASYVNGYNQPQAFIAAQGPTESTINDFWRMIYQKNCGKIVMLTNLFEELKKCERYWPEIHETQTFGNYDVTNEFENELPSFTVRHFRAVHKATKEEKEFLHLHFTAWPDRGVPDNPSVMLNFRDKVMEEITSLNGPILVHCSAGIGRTGTFVVLDYLLRQAKEESYIDIFKTVKAMRNERTNFVQTDIQYEFVHNAIYEALNVKEFEISEDKFIQQYQLMSNNVPGTSKTKLEEQFELVNEMSPKLDENDFRSGCLDENLEKSRHPDILPVDMYRAYLSTPVKGSNEFINAVFLPTCTNKTGFLITQTPMPNTITDFWRLVYDQHVTNIVMMNSIICEDESVEEYWSSKTSDCTYGPFHVKFDGTQEDFESYSVMGIQLTYTKWGEPKTMNVKLYRFEGWQNGESLPISKSLTTLISQVSGSSKDSKTEPIIVHCMDGAERSGLFCAVSAILERLKLAKKVNIPQIIMQLRARRPQLIKTMEQFDFCYRAVAEYLESYQIYSNVL